MSYEYSRDDRTVGDTWFEKETYAFFQSGLVRLRSLLDEWNRREQASPPYKREVADLSRMIEWAEERLERLPDGDEFTISGISMGSVRYLKAAATLQVLEAEAALERERPQLPTGVIAARTRVIAEMKRRSRLGWLDKVEPADVLWEVAPSPRVRTVAVGPTGALEDYEWDVFVSQRYRGQRLFCQPLGRKVPRCGLRVWYDAFELKLGDSLRRSIERGLARSRYGVVVLSPRFFAKEWPQRELDGMAALEVNGRKVVLPVWHELGAAEVRARSPMLADRVAISSANDLDAVVGEILKVVRS